MVERSQIQSNRFPQNVVSVFLTLNVHIIGLSIFWTLHVQIMRQSKNAMHPAHPRFARLSGVHNKSSFFKFGHKLSFVRIEVVKFCQNLSFGPNLSTILS